MEFLGGHRGGPIGTPGGRPIGTPGGGPIGIPWVGPWGPMGPPGGPGEGPWGPMGPPGGPRGGFPCCFGPDQWTPKVYTQLLQGAGHGIGLFGLHEECRVARHLGRKLYFSLYFGDFGDFPLVFIAFLESS